MNIGLLMTYNERDIIEEMMESNRHYVDTIFVLDGSDDGTDEVLKQYKEVELILKDKDVTPGPVRDYHRQVLLEEAHKRYGTGHWFTLLHGDEIFHDNPRLIAEQADKQGAKRVNWAAMQFFLHTFDEPVDTTKPVQERLRYYSPFWLEIRQFKSSKYTVYKEGVHGQVIPQGVGWQPFSKVPIYKHYPYRTPEQMRQRLEAMKQRGFSGARQGSNIYRERFSDEYKEVRKFDGDFAEFEMVKQGNILTMMYKWKRLVKP
jgi:glycosyltransferase involved in cell wall biosynthesis